MKEESLESNGNSFTRIIVHLPVCKLQVEENRWEISGEHISGTTIDYGQVKLISTWNAGPL